MLFFGTGNSNTQGVRSETVMLYGAEMMKEGNTSSPVAKLPDDVRGVEVKTAKSEPTDECTRKKARN